ncbi:MAG: hypothetical protein NC215_00305 [Ruminococcus sp.]|nr:hypothetical protein [Ruminococcus sp.]
MKNKIIAVVCICLLLLIVVCNRCKDNKSDTVTTAVTTVDTRIRMQSSSEGYKGLDYEEVVSELKALGFTNVKTKPLGDLIIAFFANENEVEEVSVGGSIEYSAGELFYPDIRIVVSYHSYPETGESDTSDDTTEKSTTEKTTKVQKTTTTEPEEDEEPTTEDEYAAAHNEMWAIKAVKDYGKQKFPYGIDFHFAKMDSSVEYCDNGEWYVQVPVTITNEYNSQRDTMVFAMYNAKTGMVTDFRVQD